MSFALRLSDFERKLGAPEINEDALLREAASLLLRDARLDNRLETFRLAGAFSDAAMLIHGAALPEHGFQLGLPPPLESGKRGQAFATHWRRGESFAMPFQAETPARALLLAAVRGTLENHDSRALSQCPTCRGLGWFITAENRKLMCRHGKSAG